LLTPAKEANMNIQWKFWHHQPRSGRFGQDELEYVTVGDPDPTSNSDAAQGEQTCRFGWTDETSQTLLLPWSCTRELGHQGQHLAGTGEEVAAVYPQFSSITV
jgi:hypothetical protein